MVIVGGVGIGISAVNATLYGTIDDGDGIVADRAETHTAGYISQNNPASHGDRAVRGAAIP